MPSAASSQSCSAIWSARPRSRHGSIPRICARSSARITAAAPISSPRPAGSSPSTWATGCRPISAIRWPTRHDAEHAVQAGLALVEAAPQLTTAAGVPLQVRVGIATGLVVVGDLIGAGAAQEQAVVGETPNLAARLQALAEPDAVVIADGTRRLLGNLFELKDL